MFIDGMSIGRPNLIVVEFRWLACWRSGTIQMLYDVRGAKWKLLR
jgi:hypothetical protein